MRACLVLSVLLLAAFPSTASAASRDPAAGTLTFERDRAPDGTPSWYAAPEGTVFVDSLVFHGGRRAMRIERDSTSRQFSAVSFSVPRDFDGKVLELRGWLKLEGVRGWAGLWHRQDGPGPSLQFDNMASRNLHGTIDWTEYRIALPLDPATRSVRVGALLVGTGRVWVDDLALYVDGRPLAEVPVVERPKTALDTDHEFDAGSGVTLTALTPVQTDALVTLGKVWGFLKYHDARLQSGRVHWDYELFRVLPGVLAASDHAGADSTIVRWMDGLGPVPPCSACVRPPAGDLAQRPRLDWLSDRGTLGADLVARLAQVVASRDSSAEPFFVSKSGGAGNPNFRIEARYDGLREVDAGYRLLALFRFWNMVEYWFPDRDVMGEDWDGVLRAFLPRVVSASTREAYTLTMMELIARVHDGHGNLWTSTELRPPRGDARPPVALRPVEGRVVVAGWADVHGAPAPDLRVGDEVVAVDGTPVDTLLARSRALHGASNEAALRRGQAYELLRGPRGPMTLTVERGGRRVDVALTRVPEDSLGVLPGDRHDVPGPALRRLSREIAYLKMSAVAADSVHAYLRAMDGAKLLVIDLRNYPSAFLVFALGSHLVAKETPFAAFTEGDLLNPGAFHWRAGDPIPPEAPRFAGRVAILVDEITQSSAEYHALAFRAAPGALVVGSTTAGADGNVSPIYLPGGLRTMFSGLGVFTADHRPTQRVGIVPDLAVRPTLAGLRAGRDEVLEAAVRRTLGRPFTGAERAALR